MRRDLVGRAISAGRTLRNVQRLLVAELQGKVSLPLGKRMWGWRHGFTSVSTDEYGVTKENVSLFVSDYARYVKTPRINGVMSPALHNKLVFSRLVTSHGGRAPENYCLAGDHGFLSIGDRYDMSRADGIIDACMTGERFVVKPCGGGGGLSVTIISSSDGALTLNGREVTEDEFRAFLGRLSGAVICEFIVQAKYASDIFPHSTNAIRMITMWDWEKGAPFVAFAGHRFGRTASIPVDNIQQGGIPCFVDVQSGRLDSSLSREGPRKTVRYAQHPDTGVQIEGVVVPHWGQVVSGLLELANKMAYIPYVGWDIIVTDDGFCAIEGNNHPNLGHQCMSPLLEDPRVRAFYERFDSL